MRAILALPGKHLPLYLRRCTSWASKGCRLLFQRRGRAKLASYSSSNHEIESLVMEIRSASNETSLSCNLFVFKVNF